jgi:tRNA threonylcarbamoyladenosine biosynthesis protein TsaE
MTLLYNKYCENLTQFEEIAELVISQIQNGVRVFFVQGKMGSGKTTLIHFILKKIGINQLLSSPTYGYLNTYNSPWGDLIHADLYRIDDIDQLFDIGFFEYVDKNNIMFIEWPNLVEEVDFGTKLYINLYIEFDQRRVELRLII